MDRATLDAYNSHAADYAQEWEDEQPAPLDLYELLSTYFVPGSAADIGCGSGRDTAWLAARGFAVVGYDSSEELVGLARRRHPGVRFEIGRLPKLTELGSDTFDNVMCETVIMHLPTDEIVAATGRLLSLVAPGGTLYLSWRVTDGADTRDPKGRLYSSFSDSLVLDALNGTEVLYDRREQSESSGRIVRRLILRTAKTAI